MNRGSAASRRRPRVAWCWPHPISEVKPQRSTAEVHNQFPIENDGSKKVHSVDSFRTIIFYWKMIMHYHFPISLLQNPYLHAGTTIDARTTALASLLFKAHALVNIILYLDSVLVYSHHNISQWRQIILVRFITKWEVRDSKSESTCRNAQSWPRAPNLGPHSSS